MQIQKVSLDKIKVLDRYRKDYGNVTSLAYSIAEHGLQVPLLLNDRMELCAGGRRLAAMRILAEKEAPVIVRAGLSPEDSTLIEYIENAHRKDFRWDEEARMVAKIHENKQKQESKWSVQNTANYLSMAKTTAHNRIQLAKYLQQIPTLEKCETESDAWKVINGLVERAAVAELAKRKQEELPTPVAVAVDTPSEIADVLPSSMSEPEQADSIEGMKATVRELSEKLIGHAAPEYRVGDFFAETESMPEGYLGQYSLIECDPPYGIDLDTKKLNPTGGAIEEYNEINKAEYPAFLDRLLTRLYKVSGENSKVIFWFGIEHYQLVLTKAVIAGFKVNPVPAIWVKEKSTGQNMQPRVNLSNKYETFFILRKGMPILNKFGAPNVFTHPVIPPQEKVHPTEKPISLLKEIIQTVSNPSTVSQCMVPFLGSGVTLRACQELGISAFGYDLSEHFLNQYIARGK